MKITNMIIGAALGAAAFSTVGCGQANYNCYAYHGRLGADSVTVETTARYYNIGPVNKLTLFKPDGRIITYLDEKHNDLTIERIEIRVPLRLPQQEKKDGSSLSDVIENQASKDSTKNEEAVLYSPDPVTYNIAIRDEHQIVKNEQARVDSILNLIKEKKKADEKSVIDKKMSEAQNLLR